MVSFGSDSRTFFFRPGGEEKVAMVAGEGERRRIQAHRATARRPRTQITAQRSAARMTTKSSGLGLGFDSTVDVRDVMTQVYCCPELMSFELVDEMLCATVMRS
ncbi:hypothetical protein Droror1_Dr00015695 [Drosera rotundifolia]